MTRTRTRAAHPYRGTKTHRYSHEKSTYTYNDPVFGRGSRSRAGSGHQKTRWWGHCSCGWSTGPHDHWQTCAADHRDHVRRRAQR